MTQALMQAGHDAWFAPRELRAGDPILGRVTDEIERRDAFVALLSASALKSGWGSTEIRAALAHQVSAQTPRIVPAYLDVDRLHPYPYGEPRRANVYAAAVVSGACDVSRPSKRWEARSC